MNYTIATIASHSCLQILKGAKDEGFATVAIASSKHVGFYKQYSFIDEILPTQSYKEVSALEKTLLKKNCIVVPHGSFVAYLGSDFDKKTKLPYFGSKKILEVEGDRRAQQRWLEKAGMRLPKLYKSISEVDRPVIVKMYGARGGTGYFVAQDKNELEKKLKANKTREDFVMQEYIVGIPIYIQFFYSPLSGKLEIMGVDRRYETNVDGIGRIPAVLQEKLDVVPSYTVMGNFPIVLRESLLPTVYAMGERVVEASKKLSTKGLYGPFCLETIISSDQKVYCIEISCRIVAGTNCFISGSPYSDLLFGEPMSMGRRIAREIKEAISKNRLEEILD